jgi:hypothetical protein
MECLAAALHTLHQQLIMLLNAAAACVRSLLLSAGG